ncbi:DUF4385 family protein [Bradyrhizobium sp. AUGA SZCCT0182]|uniref:DUF4385 family protein n=1 Tax=Bradyrhizobium sp. AUGA SZCCT0182 TaxID=2807667 RepID=UPI00390C7A67
MEPNQLYRVGEGEQCVLIASPARASFTPHWRFKRPGIANKAQRKASRPFLEYSLPNARVSAVGPGVR